MKELNIKTPIPPPLTSYKKKFIFWFYKHTETVDVALNPPDSSSDQTALYTFFNASLNMANFNAKVPTWWSSTNPPAYIESVDYGAMTIITVDYNMNTLKTY